VRGRRSARLDEYVLDLLQHISGLLQLADAAHGAWEILRGLQAHYGQDKVIWGSLIDDTIGALRDAPDLLKALDAAALLQHTNAAHGARALRLVIRLTLWAHPTCQRLSFPLIQLPVRLLSPSRLLVQLRLLVCREMTCTTELN